MCFDRLGMMDFAPVYDFCGGLFGRCDVPRRTFGVAKCVVILGVAISPRLCIVDRHAIDDFVFAGLIGFELRHEFVVIFANRTVVFVIENGGCPFYLAFVGGVGVGGRHVSDLGFEIGAVVLVVRATFDVRLRIDVFGIFADFGTERIRADDLAPCDSFCGIGGFFFDADDGRFFDAKAVLRTVAVAI